MKNIKHVWQIFLLFVIIVFSLLGLTGGQAVHASPNTVSVNADQDPTQGLSITHKSLPGISWQV
jgi:hypothetical protein